MPSALYSASLALFKTNCNNPKKPLQMLAIQFWNMFRNFYLILIRSLIILKIKRLFIFGHSIYRYCIILLSDLFPGVPALQRLDAKVGRCPVVDNMFICRCINVFSRYKDWFRTVVNDSYISRLEHGGSLLSKVKYSWRTENVHVYLQMECSVLSGSPPTIRWSQKSLRQCSTSNTLGSSRKYKYKCFTTFFNWNKWILFMIQ